MDPRTLRQIGSYEVKHFVDEGAFGWVFEVIDPRFPNRRLALKMLKPEAGVGDEYRRFVREVQVMAEMDHAGVVTIFDSGDDPETGCFFYTMTFVDGPTLKSRIAEGPLPVEEALPIFISLLDGLAYVHERDIVHRDIKPANVLLGQGDRPRISDFGIARLQSERGQTKTGVAVGTALYMSPEQARGRPVDARSDLFAMGLILYEALTGCVVYDRLSSVDSTSGNDVLMYIGSLVHTNSEFAMPFPREPEVPQAVQDVIRKACRMKPGDRFGDAREMRDALKRALEHSAQPVVRGGVPWRWVIAPGVLAVILAAAAFYYLGVHLPEQRKHEELLAVSRRGQAVFDVSSRIEELAHTYVDAAKDLEPPPPAELLASVEAKLARANVYFSDGDRAYADAEADPDIQLFRAAITYLSDSQPHYLEACQQLAEGFLAGRANALAAQLELRREALVAEGAPEIAVSSWPSLQAALRGVAAPEGMPDGCQAAELHFARIEAGTAAENAALQVDGELAERWPVLVEEARQESLTARELATSVDLEDRTFRLAVRDGKKSLVRGDAHRHGSRFPAARDAYRSSKQAVELPAEITPAARAREQTHALAAALAAEGAIGAVVKLISRADQAYEAERWSEAAALYAQTLEQLKGQQAEQEWRAAAQRARDDAAKRRDEALAKQAYKASPEEFERAESAFREAALSLTERRYEDAEAAFAVAAGHFETAKTQAIEHVEAARRELAALQQAAGELADVTDCSEFLAQPAQEGCAAWRGSLQASREAIASGDVPAATRRIGDAQTALERTREALRAWEEARPQPPVIVARLPQRREVVVSGDAFASFSIEATDPNDDPLIYAWSLEGAPLAASGNTLRERIPRSGTLAVRIDDGQGGELVEEWDVVVENRPPALRIVPEDRRIGMSLGATQVFQASVNDPDGDEVTTRFLIEGRVAGEGERFAFRPEAAGVYLLEVVASDPSGLELRESREIRVTPTQVAKATEVSKPVQAASVRSSGLPEVEGWRAGVIDALERYQRSIEEHDLEALERVFAMGPDSALRRYYERRFRRGEGIDVSLEVVGAIDGDERAATVEFVQAEGSSSRSGRPVRYRAHLERSSDGSWRIARRQRVE